MFRRIRRVAKIVTIPSLSEQCACARSAISAVTARLEPRCWISITCCQLEGGTWYGGLQGRFGMNQPDSSSIQALPLSLLARTHHSPHTTTCSSFRSFRRNIVHSAWAARTYFFRVIHHVCYIMKRIRGVRLIQPGGIEG